jgi:purine-binding chemotaxis protein CheW
MSATMEARPPVGGGDEVCQFVSFQVRNDLFCVPLSEVQEIIRMPQLVHVPLSPSTLEGIANLRGSVLPITNLRRVFGTEDASHDDATRVVVVNHSGTPVGFVVDRMASVITAEPGEIESVDTLEATVRSDMLRGVVKREGGMVMLLDPARLTVVGTQSGVRRARSSSGAGAGVIEEAGAARDQAGGAVVDDIQLVSFEAAGQEYAFAIEDVQEIVQVPANITRVPQAEAHVVGVMTLRDRLLPLVSLRRMFALPEAPVDEHSRIVVVAPGGCQAASVGIIMDTVKEVLRVNRALVDPVPAMLAADNGDGTTEFEAICRLEGGKRLVTILSAERMFHDATLRAAIASTASGQSGQEDAMNAGAETLGAGTDDEEQFVVFRLAGEEYAVPIDAVQEIVRVPDELTRVPKAAAFMEGVVNLRGTVLPVIDQRRRFALAEVARNDRQRIMVLTIAGVRTGFIVDQVSEVLKIPRSTIEPAPVLSDEQARLIRRVANLEKQKRMVLLLDPTDLLEPGEIEACKAH